MNVLSSYKELCEERGINFEKITSVISYDDTTLFCPAGMQKFKPFFGHSLYDGVTTANSQRCLRLNDFDEIGDGSHALVFDMIGLFSFRALTVKQTIDFFLEFLCRIGVTPTFVTVHPDRSSWSKFYPDSLEVRESEDCVWTDGEIGGYCTEMFVSDGKQDIEIGNIVNPLGHSIDVGFGLQRLNLILGEPPKNRLETLQDAAYQLISDGVVPSPNRHGYILRKILREIYKLGGEIHSNLFEKEVVRILKKRQDYEKLRVKYQNKDAAWWWDTHGIDLTEVS